MPTFSNLNFNAAVVIFCSLTYGLPSKADAPPVEAQAGAVPTQPGSVMDRLPIWGVRPADSAPLNPPAPPGSPWAEFEAQQREHDRALAALPKPTPADAKRLLNLLANQKACRVFVDLQMKNATLEEVAARIEKLLPQPAPKIEVRGAQQIRLSFALKHSTVGDALISAGNLAGVKLWVLDDKLLLAPDDAVSKDEKARSGSWSQSGKWQEPPSVSGDEVGRVFISLISEELLTDFVVADTKVVTTQLMSGDLPPSKTTFAMLSPQSQKLLRQLVDQHNDLLEPVFQLVLSPTTVVGINSGGARINSGGKGMDVLQISSSDGAAQTWALNGMSFIAQGRGGGNSSPAPGNGGIFLDPSAGQS